MIATITIDQLLLWLSLYADRVDQQADYLDQLDTPIGDSDHGANMQRGLQRFQKRLAASNSPYADSGVLMRMAATTFVSAVGGTSGSLYGAFFLRVAAATGHGPAVTLADLARMFGAGLAGIQERGKANVGDKTMVDAIAPAVTALEQACQQKQAPAAALTHACQAAQTGMEATIPMLARPRWASYFGVRSIGHQDPGATSAFYLFETAAQALHNSD